jgi:hypothetical protein
MSRPAGDSESDARRVVQRHSSICITRPSSGSLSSRQLVTLYDHSQDFALEWGLDSWKDENGVSGLALSEVQRSSTWSVEASRQSPLKLKGFLQKEFFALYFPIICVNFTYVNLSQRGIYIKTSGHAYGPDSLFYEATFKRQQIS